MTEQLSMHARYMAYMNTVKKVNPQKSHQKEKKGVFSYYYIYMRWWMLTKFIEVLISQYMLVKLLWCIPDT